jgi:hypothetical protein
VAALLRAMRAFNAAANDAKGGWQPQLPLELAVVECLSPAAPADVAEAPVAAAPARSSGPSQPAAPERPARRPVEAAEAARPTPLRPEPAPARAQPSAAPSGEGGGRSLADLKNEWNRLLRALREEDKPTEALLRSCTLVGLEGGLLRLTTSDFIYNRMQGDAETRGKVDALVAQVFGEGVIVRYEVAGKRGGGRRSDDIPQDGLVATALDLGGEIVD